MLSEKEHLENTNNEQVNNSIHEMSYNNQNIPQGFNIFLQYGFTQNEIRGLRMIYHLSTLRNSIANGRNIDLSLNAMYQRENNWLRNNNSNSNTNNNNINNNRSNIVRINLNNNNNNGFVRRRYIRIYRHEPNISFFQGLMFGIILNIFSLFILMIVRYRPKFKIGLILGMVISTIFMMFANEEKARK